MTSLACAFCHRPAVAKLRVEIAAGSALYPVCPSPKCINEASARARENLLTVAAKHGQRPDAIDVEVAGPTLPLVHSPS